MSTAARTTYLIKRVERGVKALLDEQLRGLGVTTNQYTALSVLRGRPGMSSAELARRSFVSAQAMNQVIAVLERDGLIRREPGHQKVLRTYLTPVGTLLLERCDRLVDTAEAALLSGLTPGQVLTFNSLLNACVESLNELRPWPRPPAPLPHRWAITGAITPAMAHRWGCGRRRRLVESSET